jgi:ribosomal protein RSM22 (predicted rRNA methylase)
MESSMSLNSLKIQPNGKQYQNLRVTISGGESFLLAVEVRRQGAKRWVEIIDPKSKKLVMDMTCDEAGKILAALTAAIASDRPADLSESLKGLEIPIQPLSKSQRSAVQYRT